MNNIIFEAGFDAYVNFEAGFDAYANGLEPSDNPYKEGTREFSRWLAGYNTACELGEIHPKIKLLIDHPFFGGKSK
jgi:hypothetical protein